MAIAKTEIREEVRQLWELVSASLNEGQQRLLAAAEAKVKGPGSILAVSEATGLSRPTIYAGLQELEQKDPIRAHALASGEARRPGAGRKQLIDHDPALLNDLERLVEPSTRGDPMSALRWTCKSFKTLAQALQKMGHTISETTVGTLLVILGYTLQGNAKTREGCTHPDRNAQFEHINNEAKARLAAGEPVISVDAKKKEIVGPHKNAGRTWRPQGEPEEVSVYDFEKERATPYGVYDVGENFGWVNVGITANTAQFAVQSIRLWWCQWGKELYSTAKKLLITADSGSSNGSSVRLWKSELQKLADETGLEISVCHFPPGTSKWNKIEHKLFSFISMNWKGVPLLSYEIIVSLIAGTRNDAGLRVAAQLDTTTYKTGIKVSKEEFSRINLEKNTFHGEWNYTIKPREIREVAYAKIV